MNNRNFLPCRGTTKSAGYTLIEILLATSLSLILLVSVIRIFLMMSDSFGNSRSFMDMMGKVRNTQALLQKDLSLHTAPTRSPLPVDGEVGYFSCGNIPTTYQNSLTAFTDMNVVQYENQEPRVDPTLFGGSQNGLGELVNGYVGMTICNHEEPFRFSVGVGSAAVNYETPYAEVVWFVYKNNLYRALVPVVPSRNLTECATIFPDSSAGAYPGPVPTLYDGKSFPVYRKMNLGLLGDPRYRMMTAFQSAATNPMTPAEFLKGSNVPYIWGRIWSSIDSAASATDADRAKRVMESWLVLPNVIQFQVEVWDPKSKRYISLGKDPSDYYVFHSVVSARAGTERNDLCYCYDTWSSLLCSINYDTPQPWTAAVYSNRTQQVGTQELPGDTTSARTNLSSVLPPPYLAPLPGIRIIIRTFDPDTGQVREFRVAQDFKTH